MDNKIKKNPLEEKLNQFNEDSTIRIGEDIRLTKSDQEELLIIYNSEIEKYKNILKHLEFTEFGQCIFCGGAEHRGHLKNCGLKILL